MSNVAILSSGVVVDHYGHVLLQGDAGGRALMPPTAALEPGRLPTDTLAEAIRTGTGLIVLPLRLTALFFDKGPAGDRLTLALRCLLRGGSLEREDGNATVAFFPTAPLPEPLGPADSRLVDQALHHAGGPPALETTPLGVTSRLLRRFGAGEDGPTGDWSLRVVAVMPDNDGRVAWVPDAGGDQWRLPAAPVEPGEAPWATAGRLAAAALGRAAPVAGLPAIYVDEEAPVMTLLFSHAPAPGTSGNAVRWRPPEADDPTQHPAYRNLAQTALQPGPTTLFARMDENGDAR